MAKITLDGSVSLQRLQEFAKAAGDDSIRLKEKDGKQVLYTASKASTSFKDFISGKTDERRDAGRAKLTELLGKHAENARTAIGADAHIKNLDALPHGAKLTGKQLDAFIGDVQNAISTRVSERANEAKQARVGGHAAMAAYALKWKDPEALKGITANLGNEFSARINAGFSAKPEEAAKQRTSFLTSTGENLNAQKDAYLKALAHDAGPEGTMFATKYADASPEVKKLVDDVFTHAGAKLPGNTLGPKGKDGIHHEIQINGDTYVHDKKLAEGGFGNVHRYHLKDDPDQTIVLKEPKTPQLESETGSESDIKAAKKANQERSAFIAGTRDEAAVHARVNGDEHVVRLLGVVNDEHGAVWTALENCIHGDAFEVQMGIHDESSKASQDARTAAALTLLLDQAKGLATMHDEGVTHLDYKSPNVMVGKGGVAKVADFGTSGGTKVDGRAGGAEFKITKDVVANPTWVSPLRLYGRDEKANEQLAKANDLKKAAINDVCTMMGLQSIETSGKLGNVKLAKYDVDELKRRLGSEGGAKQAKALEGQLNALLARIDEKVEKEFETKTMTFNEKADVWSFGVVAYQMLFNKGTDLPPGLNDRFASGIEDKLKEHRAAGLRGEGKPIFGGAPETLTAQEKFVNWLLPPREEDSPSMAEVVRHPIFKDLLGEGVVGSKEAREFIESSANLFRPKAGIGKDVRAAILSLNKDALGFDVTQFVSEMESRFPLEPKSVKPWFAPERGKPFGWVEEVGNLLSRAAPDQIDAMAQDVIQTLMLDAKQGESLLKAVEGVKSLKASALKAEQKALQLDALIA